MPNWHGHIASALCWKAPPGALTRTGGRELGYDAAALQEADRKAIDLLLEVRAAYENAETPIVISGNLGPRGDGYKPGSRMTASEAKDYHAAQIETFRQTEADMVAPSP